MNKERLKKILNYIILASLMLILFFSTLVIVEQRGAMNYCKSLDGEFVTKVLEGRYTCNNETLIKTNNDKWLLESDLVNFDNIILEKD